MAQTVKDVLEEELIFGARDREARWRRIAFWCAAFGASGCLLAAAMALAIDKPPPALIPFDPSTGSALPNVNLQAIPVTQQDAVVQSLIFAYVRDRETYNDLDNDVRIEGVFARSKDQARVALQELWNPESKDFPPKVYGKSARLDVQVLSISDLGNNRAQARITKRLTTPDGATEGTFIVTLAYEFDPASLRDLTGVWSNPFGFTVSKYSVSAERFK